MNMLLWHNKRYPDAISAPELVCQLFSLIPSAFGTTRIGIVPAEICRYEDQDGGVDGYQLLPRLLGGGGWWCSRAL